jgi:NarL family two-component system response regulator LiaR
VVGMANDGAEAIERIAEVEPDVVLMDLKMPGMNGIQAMQKINELYPHIQVLVLTTYAADEWVFDAIRSGAAGYLLKGTPRTALIEAVKGTAEGKTHVDPAVAGKLFDQIARKNATPPDTTIVDQLSDRELDVLRLLAHGLSNAEIANRLYLSAGTVRNYVSAILAKLEVADRTQAAVLALRYGLVDLSEI